MIKIKIGYACLNTTLDTCFKGVTLRTLEKMDLNQRIDKLNSISLVNIGLVESILEYNSKNGLLLYRIPTNLLPFPTHPISNGWDWRSILKPCFQHIGKIAKNLDIRLSFHADEFTVMNSPNQLVWESSWNTLIYLSDVLDMMKLKNPDIVLHIGGTYGNKDASIKRFIERFTSLPLAVKEKIVIENDDKQYDWADTFFVAKELNIPMVLDTHHYRVFNYFKELNTDSIKDIFSTWNTKKPKIHLSSPQPQKTPRAHADYVDINDFVWFYKLSHKFDYDIMIEAKAKELAALKFRKDLNLL